MGKHTEDIKDSPSLIGFFYVCGSGNSAIELTIPELEVHSGYESWVDVCKGYTNKA